ncbi:MAG: SDR family oxidoreductase [Chloroflexota bacterium]|nr:MAG: SDR family oxidoreductase [Chloroflexota bacterium]
MNCPEMHDRVVIVTGSSSGIGQGIAARFAREGARVVLAARSADKLERNAQAARDAGGTALAVPADVSQRVDVERLFERTLSAYGRVDAIINNAAWASPRAHILEMDEAHWDTVIATNLKSVYLCCHRAANVMVDAGIKGSIVNISSFAAARAHRAMAAYDATKAGLEGMSRTMAIDLGPFGIRVNVVGPGAIHTQEYDPLGEEARRNRGKTVPLGRVGYPEDIAGAVLFLCSDDASYVTGQIIYVDGGMLAQLRSPQVDSPLPESVARRLRS